MIKAIHFADYHLGVSTYGSTDPETKLNERVLDFLDSLDALIDYAIDNAADIVLFAGDAFHKHSPDPTLQREFGDRMVRLAEHCPVILLVGNHDVTGVPEKASAIDIFATLRVPNIIVGYDYQVITVDTANGPIQVATAPFPMKNQFLSNKEKSRPDSMAIMKKKFAKILQRLASQVDPCLPAVLLGHFSVNSAVYSSERNDYLGDEATVDISNLVNEAWDYVALGHLHYHQDLSMIVGSDSKYIPPIVYAGSLDRVDFSEEKHKKGFVWVEFDTDGASWEFVETDARPFITIDVNVCGVENQTQRIISKIKKLDLKGAVVRLNVIADKGRSASINHSFVNTILEESGVFCIHAFSIREERTFRSRIEGNVPMTEMSHDEMLLAYFQTIGIEGKKANKLLGLAGNIMNEVNGV